MEKNKQTTIKDTKNNDLMEISKKLYNSIKEYVLSKGGFIETQNKDGKKNNIFADTIEAGDQRGSKYIYGIKVVNNDLLLATEYINLEEPQNFWEKEEFNKEENWKSLLHSGYFVILPTLFCIADTIEEY